MKRLAAPRCLLAIFLVFAPFAVLAQQPPAPQPAPRLPTVQTPTDPAATQTPPPPAPRPAAPGAPTPAPSQPTPVSPTPAPPPPNTWLPKPVADLVALDKVTARTTPITVRVGQSAAFGSLTVAVRACAIRPPDQPADATAFLDITDSHPGGPQFHGWMMVSAPWVSMLEHPIYDVRVVGCHE